MKHLIIGIVIAASALCSLSVSADNYKQASFRDGKWEATFQLGYSGDDFIQSGDESSLKIDSDLGWGVSLGYNINSNFLVNFELASFTPKYEATFALDKEPKETETINHKLNMVTTHFNAVYNITKGRLAPYLQVGAGWTYIDSNIANGPPIGGCWWDPWWGYICDGFQPTHTDTNYSYNYGVGVRYELANNMLLKASYGMVVTNMDHSEDMEVDVFKIEIGSVF